MSRARDTASIIQYNHLTIDDANDRIGIGISAPSEKLSVLGVGQFVNTNTVYINGNYGNEGVAFQNASNVPTIFTTGNNEKMRITSAGLVGIGITNPSYKLEVSGNVRINNGSADALDMSNGNIISVNYLSFADPGPGEGIKWGGGSGWEIYESPNDLSTNSAGNLQFVDSGSRIFTLDTSGNAEITGNLGVGTDNPAVKLHVYGGALRIAGNDSEGGEINFTDNDGTTVNAHLDVDANGAFRMFTTAANKSLIIGQLVNSGANISFHTSAAERVRIDSSGNFGVGTATPGSYPGKLVVVGDGVSCDREFNSRVSNSISNAERGFMQITDGAEYLHIYSPNGGDNVWEVQGTERLRIDNSGRLLINQSTSSPSLSGLGAFLQVNEGSGVAMSINRSSGADAFGPNIVFRKTRSSSANGTTVVASGDGLGQIYWMGTDGTSAIPAAAISSVVDGTPGANDMPGRIVFSTTADGASSPTERFRIDSRGSFQFSNGFMNETVNINTTARTGTQTVNLDDGMVHYFSTNSTATWKPNFTISTGNDINATIATGDVFSPTLIVAKGATFHYATAIQVDGTDVTPEWLGGAPTDGGGSGTFDVYSYSIIKTGNDTFKAFASVSTYE